jgi:sporulation protein YlmC with PRC-barrel domain
MSDVVFESEWLEVTGYFVTDRTVIIKCSNGQEYAVPYSACPAVGQRIKIQFDCKSNPIEWRV